METLLAKQHPQLATPLPEKPRHGLESRVAVFWGADHHLAHPVNNIIHSTYYTKDQLIYRRDMFGFPHCLFWDVVVPIPSTSLTTSITSTAKSTTGYGGVGAGAVEATEMEKKNKKEKTILAVLCLPRGAISNTRFTYCPTSPGHFTCTPNPDTASPSSSSAIPSLSSPYIYTCSQPIQSITSSSIETEIKNIWEKVGCRHVVLFDWDNMVVFDREKVRLSGAGLECWEEIARDRFKIALCGLVVGGCEDFGLPKKHGEGEGVEQDEGEKSDGP